MVTVMMSSLLCCCSSYQYLLAPPTSAVQDWNYSPPEEVFHQVSILTPDRAVEGGGRPLVDGGANCTTEPEATVQEEEEEEEKKATEEEEEAQEKEEVNQLSPIKQSQPEGEPSAVSHLDQMVEEGPVHRNHGDL